MANITLKEAREVFSKYNDGRKTGVVFDAVLETMVFLINESHAKSKKTKQKPGETENTDIKEEHER